MKDRHPLDVIISFISFIAALCLIAIALGVAAQDCHGSEIIGMIQYQDKHSVENPVYGVRAILDSKYFHSDFSFLKRIKPDSGDGLAFLASGGLRLGGAGAWCIGGSYAYQHTSKWSKHSFFPGAKVILKNVDIFGYGPDIWNTHKPHVTAGVEFKARLNNLIFRFPISFSSGTYQSMEYGAGVGYGN